MGQKLVMKCLPGIAQTLDQGEELRNKILSAISVKKDITVISDCSQLWQWAGKSWGNSGQTGCSLLNPYRSHALQPSLRGNWGNKGSWSQVARCRSKKWFQSPDTCIFSYTSEVAQSRPTLCNPWTVASQAPPSTGFSRQEYWSGLPFHPPGEFSTIELPGKPKEFSPFLCMRGLPRWLRG